MGEGGTRGATEGRHCGGQCFAVGAVCAICCVIWATKVDRAVGRMLNECIHWLCNGIERHELDRGEKQVTIQFGFHGVSLGS